MKSPLPDYLLHLLKDCETSRDGKVADYIPELARVHPDSLALAICTSDGTLYSAGDADLKFTIQSMSKPFAYALALQTLGLEAVLKKIDAEPSGDAFNELSLDKASGRPRNPMINAGALATHALLPGKTPEQRADALKGLLEQMVGHSLDYDEAVCTSEMDTAHRNMALAHMLKSVGIIEADPHEIVQGYTRQCAIRVTVRELAKMAAVLASKGVLVDDGTRVFSNTTVRQVLSVMTTCGMYDAAGDWLTQVGIPAKSGVSGGILGALPGQLGVAVMSPRIDRFGNSVRGVRIMEQLSETMGLHIMEALQTPRSTLRNPQFEKHSNIDVFELQGDIHFSQAELLLRSLSLLQECSRPVMLDISRVHELSTIGHRILLDALDSLQRDGHWVALIDPCAKLPEAKDSGVQHFDTLDSALQAAGHPHS